MMMYIVLAVISLFMLVFGDTITTTRLAGFCYGVAFGGCAGVIALACLLRKHEPELFRKMFME